MNEQYSNVFAGVCYFLISGNVSKELWLQLRLIKIFKKNGIIR